MRERRRRGLGARACARGARRGRRALHRRVTCRLPSRSGGGRSTAPRLLAEVPDYIWNGETLPVPIEDIADTHVGLLVRDVEDMTTAPGAPELADDQSLSGLLLAEPGRDLGQRRGGKQWPPRRRFTIGHELGHWRLHREPGQQTLFCRQVRSRSRRGPPAARPDRGGGQSVRRRAADAGGADPPRVRAQPRLRSGSATCSAHRGRRWASGCTR